MSSYDRVWIKACFFDRCPRVRTESVRRVTFQSVDGNRRGRPNRWPFVAQRFDQDRSNVLAHRPQCEDVCNLTSDFRPGGDIHTEQLLAEQFEELWGSLDSLLAKIVLDRVRREHPLARVCAV